jgi:asparagine synthase (glutamine-hydrolysing)
MCGIAGVLLEPGRDAGSLRERAEAMASAMLHRGPDDGGAWVDAAAGVALSHRRLAIIDLSPAGHQPMASADGRFQLVFNGEIYNFAALRDELVALGHRFRGGSDTEVMLAAFVQWGVEAAVGRFVGMFAFAAWDAGERALWLARDRFGEKPLYYAGLGGGGLAFASELKALRAQPGFEAELDRAAVVGYLRGGYVPGAMTIHRGARKLPPGQLARVVAGGAVEPRAYWRPRDLAILPAAPPEDADEEFHRLLRQAVSGQMVADVPLGAFLSGGIDSSTVVAVMQSLSSRPVRTFTIGFREEGFDEAAHGAAVARHLGTEHTELYVTAREARETIPRLASIYDEPFADPSQIPTALLCALTRRSVTVALSGDGGDELFGGYERYALTRRVWRTLTRLPRLSRTALAAGIRALPGWALSAALAPARVLGRRGRLLGPDKARRFAALARTRDFDAFYQALIAHWEDASALVIDAPMPPAAQPAAGPARELERMMLADQESYLPDDILVKVDRAAMASSLETRVPLLDHRIAAFAWRAVGLAERGGRPKALMRSVLDRYVPRELIDRPKMGFGVPIGDWLRGPLREWAESLLDERALARDGLLRPAPIRRAWRDHLAGRRDGTYRLWDVLMLRAWAEAARA